MKIGRNAPCPCGSGKKYKKCCLLKDQEKKQKNTDPTGLNQATSPKSRQKKDGNSSGIRVRPYIFAKMCDPETKLVQHIFRHKPELKRTDLTSLSQMRSLSKEQIIEKLSEQGIVYDQEQFIAMCQKKSSAWGVAEALWPKQIKSWEPSVSDTTGLGACMLWEKLYDEKKLTKVSVEMLDDWMESGYLQLDQDIFSACRIWMRVWETFKINYDLPRLSIDELDRQFNGSQSFFNWCQDFELELLNASIDSKELAELGVTYLSEFLDCFSDEDEQLISRLKSSLGEYYCQAGDQETGENMQLVSTGVFTP